MARSFRYRKQPPITFNANDAPLNKAFGAGTFRANGVVYQNLNDAWLQVGNYKFAAPNSNGTFSLDGELTAQVQWNAPPGITQTPNTAGKVAYLTYTEEPLPDSGGPLALGMNNPMTTLGDMITALAGGVPTRLGIGSAGQVLTVVGGVPAWATPAAVANVQRGSIVITGAGTFDATITSVDLTRSVVVWVGQRMTTGTNAFGTIKLLNATTVRATTLAGDPAAEIYFNVITYASGSVKSLQDVDNLNFASPSVNQTITSINLAKTVLIYRGLQHDTNELAGDFMWGAKLINATTITFLRNASAGGIRASLTVLEGN